MIYMAFNNPFTLFDVLNKILIGLLCYASQLVIPHEFERSIKAMFGLELYIRPLLLSTLKEKKNYAHQVSPCLFFVVFRL